MNSLTNDTERFWDQVLQFVEEGRVVPVIGPELLAIEIEGRRVHLYRYLAERLAAYLQIGSDPEDTLNAVSCRYLVQRGQIDDIYPALKRVMPPAAGLVLPETLVKLAEIRPLKLFVSTTFDPLLAHALNTVRYGGQEKTQVLAFSPQSTQDLPCDIEQLDRATVFHLFGRLSAVPEYAVTDEDILEFMHALQAKTGRPEHLFDAIVGRNLLIIGCALSDWLARFFVRIGKRERLSIARGKTDVLADERVRQDSNLVYFLQHFSDRTKIFPGGATEFVNELHRRWTEAHPATPPPPPQIEDPVGEIDKMEVGAVFLSYASEDRSAVELIRDALEQAGIDVWFDRNAGALRAGEDFEVKIKTNIDKCSLFIPIISRNTLTPVRRFFRIEWDYAQKVATQVLPSMRFIIPVVIDDTRPNEPAIPERSARCIGNG